MLRPGSAAATKGTQISRASFRSSSSRPVVRAAAMDSSSAPLKVVVTGAAGRTGSLVVKKLLERPQQFSPRAVVREQSKGKVVSMGVKEGDVFVADVAAGKADSYSAAFSGADAVVLATSGVPQLKPLSMFKVIWAKITGQKGVMPDFTWKEGQNPEQVDWLGAKAQVDAAVAAGVKHFVVIGSMGGTQPDNYLNRIGDGNILKFKRKAEQYLIASGLTYTIIHPGGLNDEKGGERQVLLDVDDKLLKRTVRSIPREDVAELVVQCLTIPEAKNRAFDAIAPKEEGQDPTSDWPALIASLKGANCDYTIESQL